MSPPSRPDVRQNLLEAAERCLRAHGFASFSTRKVADEAGAPLSQIHYHFGSKQNLLLALFAAQNEQLLARQHVLYGGDDPLHLQWQQACDFLEDDLRSGYVRILQEMVGAGWSDPAIARAVREQLGGWVELLAEVAERAEERFGGLGPFTAREIAALVSAAFLGAESMILLGVDELTPVQPALRRVGDLIRQLEEGGA